MIVSRRKRADRLSSAALVCLAAGLCGAAWLALKPPAPAEPSRAPAASPPVSAAAPVAAGRPITFQSSGRKARLRRPPAIVPGGRFPASGGETPPFTILGLIASLSGSSSCRVRPVVERRPDHSPGRSRRRLEADRRHRGTPRPSPGTGGQVTLSLAKREYARGRRAHAGNRRFGTLVAVVAVVPGESRSSPDRRNCRRPRSRRTAPASQPLQPPSVRRRPRRPTRPCRASKSRGHGPDGSDRRDARSCQIQMPNGQSQGITVSERGGEARPRRRTCPRATVSWP